MRYPPVAGVGLGAKGALSIRRAGAVVVEGRLVIFLCIVLCSTRDDDLVEVDEQDCVGSQSSRNQTTTKLSHGRAIFKETAAVFPFNGTPIVLIGVFVEKGHRRKTRSDGGEWTSIAGNTFRPKKYSSSTGKTINEGYTLGFFFHRFNSMTCLPPPLRKEPFRT